MRAADRPRLCRVAGRKAWHIYIPGGDRRRITTGCASRAEAETVLASYLESLDRPRLPVVTVGAILSLYLADRRERGIPGADRLGFAHKPLVRVLGVKPPETITESECRRYATRRRRDGVSDATIRTEMAALKAALRWAAGQEVGIIAGAPKISMPPRPASRVRWLTREESDRLISACRAPHVKLFVSIALNTGARSGAILALTWERVDLNNRLIDFREPDRARTRKRRVPVPINDTLLAALTAARAGATAETVIEWAGGGVARIKHAFRDAASRAGLTGVTPHVLRHTAVTRMLQAGVVPWEVAGFTGMTLEMVQEVYGHHHSDYLRNAAKALG